MKKHYFLDKASDFSVDAVFQQLFAFGTEQDLTNLRGYLAERYHTDFDKVALYNTGRSALAAAIKSIAPKNSKILITSLTCYAVVEAVKAAGCVPVFADIDKNTLHYGRAELSAALKKHPDIKVIIVQNNLGHPADIAGIEDVCKKQGIEIIEDLAHSAGIQYVDGREAGTVGSATILSFGKGKSVDVIAGGALILRRDSSKNVKQPSLPPKVSDSLRARFYPLFGLFMRGFSYVGLMRYFTSFLLKIHFIERSADAKLSSSMRCTCWQARLALKKLIALPENRPPIREFLFVHDRDQLLEELRQNGYYFDDIWYTLPVSPERYYHKVGYNLADFPVATEAARTIINLPSHYSASAIKPARKIIERFIDES